MNNIASEIIQLQHASVSVPETTYELQFISTDKRAAPGEKTTIGVYQVGGPTLADKIGNTNGPVYMMEFVNIPAGQHIRVWADGNDDADVIIYPTDYLIANPKLNIWLKKFEWTDAAGVTETAPGSYTILGHRKLSKV